MMKVKELIEKLQKIEIQSPEAEVFIAPMMFTEEIGNGKPVKIPVPGIRAALDSIGVYRSLIDENFDEDHVVLGFLQEDEIPKLSDEDQTQEFIQ